MTKELTIDIFLKKRNELPVIDVRTPAEFQKGHIPGAVNIPLFDDDERAEIGKLYKQQGRDQAVLRGLELVAPKLVKYVQKSKEVSSDNTVLVHCWRGGMRSSNFAWLLGTAGLKAFTLLGGYKAYRRFVRGQFEIPANIIVIGGMTGSGKTEILHEMHNKGHQVIDLEGLASHKGSGFGFINMGKQPSNEQFENDLYEVWKCFDYSQPIWIEDESKKIGKIVINDPLFNQMRQAPLLNLVVSKESRIKRLESEYCTVSKDVLQGVIYKITRRLGPQRTQKALHYINENDFYNAIDIVLDYYDRGYMHGMAKRETEKILTVDCKKDDPKSCAKQIIELLPL